MISPDIKSIVNGDSKDSITLLVCIFAESLRICIFRIIIWSYFNKVTGNPSHSTMAVVKSKPILRRRHRLTHHSAHHIQNRRSCLSLADLATSPLFMLDLVISSLFWLHTMLFQLTLYGVYIGLFVFCHATGAESAVKFRVIYL